MRILIISLLRIGDIFLSVPALRALRKKYPRARIDLLVNSPYKFVHPFLSCVDSVIEFDRGFLQDSLVSTDRPLFESYDVLKELVEELNQNKYDLLVNLTQNKLSGYLTSMVQTSERLGLAINSREQSTFGSAWFKYLNDVVAGGAKTIFHYSDIFYFGVGGEKGQQDWTLTESTNGKNEAEVFFRRHGFKAGPKIVIQALTSDIKKNWGHERWVQALCDLKIFIPDSQFIVMGSQAEKNDIDQIVSELEKKGVDSYPALVSLEGALSILNLSDLLITGDTSIKHMACSTQIQVLEIALGSSDLRKTGSYKKNSIILRSRAKCAPCDHSKACSQQSHLCAQDVKPELVSLSANLLLKRDFQGLKILAQEFENEVEIYSAQCSALGFWHCQNVLPSKQGDNVIEQIEKLAWKFLLEKEHLKSPGAFGSESFVLGEELSLQADGEIIPFIKKVEIETLKAETRLYKILADLSKEMHAQSQIVGVDFVKDSLKFEIQKVEKDLRLGNFLTEKINIDQSTGLYRVRQLQNSIADTFSLQQIKLKLIRDIKSQFMG